MEVGFFSLFFYLLILLAIGFASHKKHQTSSDFILGSRKMNFWVTALSAHASDMSGWVFMAYPAVILSRGLFESWVAIGLIIFMFLNWQFVAPKIRRATEKYNSLTLSSFFESRFNDTSGAMRICTVLASLIFYLIYISAGLVSLGLLTEQLFSIPYSVGVSLGICVVIPYLLIGGYITLAWTDLFQGLFLLVVILTVPMIILYDIGGWAVLIRETRWDTIFPDTSFSTLSALLFALVSWGLGYFGQPHIITKFMGIQNPQDMHKSKWVGMSWLILSLGGATLIGLIGSIYFQHAALENTELVFIQMVLERFQPILSVFMLCAILGAIVTSTDAQILVLISNLTEDLYKKIIRKSASSNELLIVSRCNIVLIAAIAYYIAVHTTKDIFTLVSYAWFGLGAAFGPVTLFGLYVDHANKYGAWAGIIVGTILSAIWPLINIYLPWTVPTLIPGFVCSCLAIWIVSYATQPKRGSISY